MKHNGSFGLCPVQQPGGRLGSKKLIYQMSAPPRSWLPLRKVGSTYGISVKAATSSEVVK